jgi:hypothetical protein
MSARLPRLAALAASTLVIVACGGGPAPSSAPPSSTPNPPPTIGPSTAPPPSAVPASLLLKVTSEGGFINPSANLAALPIVEVYSDGRILTPGAIPMIAPGPLLPHVDVREVGSAGAAAILAAIRQAGLDKPSTAGPGIPGDSGTDVFTVTVDGQTTETRLAGNGPGVGDPGVGGGSDDPHRAAAFDLVNRLLDSSETWGAASPVPSTYDPIGYRIFVAPGAPSNDPATPQTPIAWPLATPLAAFGTTAVPDRGIAGLRQGAAVGADAATLKPLLQAATVETAFTSGGKSYTLFVRPLLPDELGG